MTVAKLEKAAVEIGANRREIADKIENFMMTDMLLFWGTEKDLVVRQEKLWGPILEWAKQVFETDFVKTHGLDVPEQDEKFGEKLRSFINNLSDRELAAFYLAALNMRSVLLAAALVKGRISAEEAFRAAYLEELWQAENWGADEEAEKKRGELRRELIDIEKFLKEKK